MPLIIGILVGIGTGSWALGIAAFLLAIFLKDMR